MRKKTLFEKIIDREVPAKIIYEDNLCIAIEDINPQAPTHVLLIPKKPIEKFSDLKQEDKDLLAYLCLKVNEIALICNIADSFRININNGKEAGQEVFHLHIHILGGRKFSWPPG